jgi:hypothetical protein
MAAMFTTGRTLRIAAHLPLALLGLAAACRAQGQATAQQIEAAATRGDTVALARLAERSCDVSGADKRRSCYEQWFLSLASHNRVTLALGALAELGSRNHEVERDGHGYTHIIGIRSWKPGDDVAQAFRACNGLYQSGCYHGVIQAYLTATGTLDSTRAVGLCDVITPKADEQWLRFQCVHGLGHGFDMIDNWNLPQALKRCDWLGTSWDRNSCYGGAFMENAVASMPGGHHMAMDALTATTPGDSMAGMAMDDHGGMDHQDHMPNLKTITYRMRDSADALYPCDALDSIYGFSCFEMQGGLILDRVHGDFARAAAECDKATPIFRTQCYLSLGTNASGMTVRNIKQTIEKCSHGDPGYQPYCFVGAVKNFVDVTAKPQDGFDFCREVPAGPNQMQCYIAVGEEIDVLWPADAKERSHRCEAAGLAGEKWCRVGARLPETL